MVDRALVDTVKSIAATAAERIMEVYDSRFAVEHKDDRSPLTEADLAAHRVIVCRLRAATPDVPVLSEEASAVPHETRRRWERYWLVDPLDGTREFVGRNGEFTVNIALIDAHRPILGVVWIPVDGRCYFAAEGHGAFRQAPGRAPERITARRLPAERIAIAGSRSHGNPETSAFIERVERRYPGAEMKAMGSSLKFCLVAEGAVDVYPRFGPTSEWDTAAAQCVVEAAGGRVTDLSLSPLRYNTKDSLLNPHFLVFGDASVDWSTYLGG